MALTLLPPTSTAAGGYVGLPSADLGGADDGVPNPCRGGILACRYIVCEGALESPSVRRDLERPVNILGRSDAKSTCEYVRPLGKDPPPAVHHEMVGETYMTTGTMSGRFNPLTYDSEYAMAPRETEDDDVKEYALGKLYDIADSVFCWALCPPAETVATHFRYEREWRSYESICYNCPFAGDATLKVIHQFWLHEDDFIAGYRLVPGDGCTYRAPQHQNTGIAVDCWSYFNTPVESAEQRQDVDDARQTVESVVCDPDDEGDCARAQSHVVVPAPKTG